MPSSREVRNLSSQLNHDLREPINSIRRKLELLEMQTVTKPEIETGRSEFTAAVQSMCDGVLASIRDLRNQVIHSSVSDARFATLLEGIVREASRLATYTSQSAQVWLKPTSDQERHVSHIHATAVRFQKMLRALLSVARISEPQFQQTNYRNQALTASRYILEQRATTADSSRADVTFDWDDSKATGFADQGMILTILQNLYENAVKYRSPQRPLVIRTRLAELGPDEIARRWTVSPDILDERADRYVHVRISDNGIGIPASGLQKIFDPYVQLKKPGRGGKADRADDAKDVGIGLYSVRKMVAFHRGHVLAESDGRSGSHFHLLVPSDPRILHVPEEDRDPDRTRLASSRGL
jgi:signal transduction histidine kinase